jgi:preprotein translocase subunit SecD
MDRSLKWRTFALLFGLLLCACLLAPTWPGADALPSWFPFKKQISLGLDLQGGLHIVYAIDLDKAVDDKASEIKRDLDTRFADPKDKIAAKVKTPAPRTSPTEIPLGAVVVVLEEGKRKAEIEALIQSDNRGTIEPYTCSPDDGPHAICFRVSTSYAEGIKKAALTNAVTTIRERINEKGVSEPSVVEKGDSIIVELPGDPDGVVMRDTREIIARTAKLEFKVVDDSTDCLALDKAAWATSPKCFPLRLSKRVAAGGDATTDPKAIELAIRSELSQWRPKEGGVQRTEHYLTANDRDELVPVAWATKHGCRFRKADVENGKVRCPVTGRQALERYLFGDPDLNEPGVIGSEPGLKLPDDHQIGFEPNEPDPTATEKRTLWRTYYLDRAVRLTGAAIANAMPSNDPNTGQPLVLLDFNRFGGNVFGALTKEIVGQRLAAILDDKVRSAPQINEPILGGRASITLGGGGDIMRQEREREELVNVLKTGSLPAPLREESASTLGPTLGRDAIDKTKLSFGIGIVLVVMIMVGIYRWSGGIAVFAVVFHIVMTLAVMAAFGATLTLPGVAAIVLSVGMEVDGNILIYERIRDELLLGKSVRGAVDLGFSRAFSAILDGQLTTAAAGWVLLQYGSGPIKGFAVMLLVGVFTTLSTNIWVTRIFFDWYIARKKGQLATISI